MSFRGRTGLVLRGGRIFAFLALCIISLCGETRCVCADYRVYVGTYTSGASEGIYAFDFNTSTRQSKAVQMVAKTENPSFLAIHANRLYAANEVTLFEGDASGAVSAYRIQGDGGLVLLNQWASGGGAPCHLVVDDLGKSLLVANYVGGNVASFQLAADGRIRHRNGLIQHLGSSVNRRRQNAPHAHSINLDPSNRFAAAADLGVDRVFVYPFDPISGALELGRASSVALEPGAGPRHFAFHPNGKLAFVNNELHSNLTSLAFDKQTGEMRALDTESTLPEGFEGSNSTAETQVHPNGRSVYVSNRGHNSIAHFRVDPKTGEIEKLGVTSTEGRTPRNFCLTPEGDFLFAANQSSDTVVVFPIHPRSGRLEASVGTIEVPSPVCVKFLSLN